MPSVLRFRLALSTARCVRLWAASAISCLEVFASWEDLSESSLEAFARRLTRCLMVSETDPLATAFCFLAKDRRRAGWRQWYAIQLRPCYASFSGASKSRVNRSQRLIRLLERTRTKSCLASFISSRDRWTVNSQVLISSRVRRVLSVSRWSRMGECSGCFVPWREPAIRGHSGVSVRSLHHSCNKGCRTP